MQKMQGKPALCRIRKDLSKRRVGHGPDRRRLKRHWQCPKKRRAADSKNVSGMLWYIPHFKVSVRNLVVLLCWCTLPTASTQRIAAADVHVLLCIGVGDGRILCAIVELLAKTAAEKKLRIVGMDCAAAAIAQAKKQVAELAQHSHHIEFCHQDAQQIRNVRSKVNHHTVVVVKDVLQHWKCSEVVPWLDKVASLECAALLIANDCRSLLYVMLAVGISV
jgi:2-polyprenyl-3-methyl-5-hydroxy-6-metoxy-1,4-benzoquinol methylase